MRQVWTLRSQLTLGAIALTLVALLVAGAVSAGLVLRAGGRQAAAALARRADLAVPALDGARRPATVERLLRGSGTQVVRIAAGVPTATCPTAACNRAARAVAAAGDAVTASPQVSTSVTLGGTELLVEARTQGGQGWALVQALADATAETRQLLGQLALAGLGILALAAVVATLGARYLSAPLRRAAAASRALASGRRDVTLDDRGPAEVAEVTAALHELSGALAASESRQREFLLSVSHDLRTPLTALHGYAEALADGVIAPAETAQVGQTLRAETERLQHLVEDLLALARLEADDFRVDAVPVDLVALIRAGESAWNAGSPGPRVTVDLPTTSVVAAADPMRVRQVLDSLVGNAARVCGNDDSIVVAVRSEAGQAVVEVRDSGPGLADEDLSVAFERGVLHDRYRGRRPVGQGLGLAIVARLVAAMGGGVQAGHAPEGGAAFTVRLPLAAGQPGRGLVGRTG